MICHTLILSTAKIFVPENITSDFVLKLVNRGLTLIEYFGVEIDNQSDYVDDDMLEASSEITYIEIYFETSETIDYATLSEQDVDELLLDLFETSTKSDIISDGKDITVHLHSGSI